jgi:hypothetical protein
MESEMIILLLILAALPLMGLESLRWYCKEGNPRVCRKALWLAASSSVFWALLGDYVGTAYHGWGWVSPLLLCVGGFYAWKCAGHYFTDAADRRPVRHVLLAYIAVFIAVVWIVPDWLWLKLQDHIGATGALSRYRGPLN